MAKAKLNPIITAVHGRIDRVIFYHRSNEQYIRTHVTGSNPDTEAQRTVRRTFADAVRSWQAMSDEERFKFNRRARSLNMSGYNLHISQYMRTRISGMIKPCIRGGTSDKDLHGLEIPSPGLKPITSVSPPFHLRL